MLPLMPYAMKKKDVTVGEATSDSTSSQDAFEKKRLGEKLL